MKKLNVEGVTIYEPNGDSSADFLQDLTDDAKAKGLSEVRIKGIDNAARARVVQFCKERGLKVSFED